MPDHDLRLLAEAVRRYEATAGPLDAAAANAAARDIGGDLEQRIITRATWLDPVFDMSGALSQVRSAARLAISVLLLIAALGGLGAVQAAMGPGADNVVNFFGLIVATLGIATASLAGWLMVAVFGRGRVGAVGRLAAAAAGRVAKWTHGGPVHLAALGATAGIAAGGPLGRWSLGAVTHGVWLVFLTAVLANAVFLLSTRSYIFVWETTILSADAYIPLTRWLAAAPALVGFPVPTAEDVRASEWVGRGEAAAVARDAWAGLLVGAIVVYGIVPRAMLLALCLALNARARRTFRLDTAQPGFARLEPHLMPHALGRGFADTNTGTEPERVHVRHNPTARRIAPDPLGPVAVLGLEIDEPAIGWPPPLGTSIVLDLGRVESRQGMRDALDRLRHARPAPRFVIVVFSLTAVPDRGLLAHIDHIAAVSAIPLGLVLTGGQQMRVRGDIRTRIADWRTLAREAGIAPERVIEVDLDHMTDASLSKLGAFAGEPGEDHDQSNRLGRAFSVIRTSVETWHEPPDAETQAELHRRIARLYRGGEGAWHQMFDPRTITAGNLPARLKSGADLLVGVLPGRLAGDRRWLAAGAAAGALGCVAAATLAVPGAIAGLPLWAGLGAALAATIRSALGGTAAPQEVRPDVAGAVRAAALFTLALDAQGHEELAITRMIDDAIGDEDAPLETEAEVAEWLDRVHMRYRDSERREAAR